MVSRSMNNCHEDIEKVDGNHVVRDDRSDASNIRVPSLVFIENFEIYKRSWPDISVIFHAHMNCRLINIEYFTRLSEPTFLAVEIANDSV